MHQKDQISLGLDTGVKNCMMKVLLTTAYKKTNFKSTLTSHYSKMPRSYFGIDCLKT